MKDNYFLLDDLKNILNSNLIQFLQDTSSYLDFFIGPGVYFYSIPSNYVESIKKVILLPFYNYKKIKKELKYKRKKIGKDICDIKENFIKTNFLNEINEIKNNDLDEENIETIYFPYSSKDGVTERFTDIISISCYFNETNTNNVSFNLLYGCARLLIILIHELIGHLLKSKISRITKRKIRWFTESGKKKKYDKKEAGLFIEYKMFGKKTKTINYSQCIYILDENSYKQNPRDFLINYKKVDDDVKFYDKLNIKLKCFLKSLFIDQYQVQTFQEEKMSPGVALRETKKSSVKFPLKIRCGLVPINLFDVWNKK